MDVPQVQLSIKTLGNDIKEGFVSLSSADVDVLEKDTYEWSIKSDVEDCVKAKSGKVEAKVALPTAGPEKMLFVVFDIRRWRAGNTTFHVVVNFKSSSDLTHHLSLWQTVQIMPKWTFRYDERLLSTKHGYSNVFFTFRRQILRRITPRLSAGNAAVKILDTRISSGSGLSDIKVHDFVTLHP